MNTWILDVAGLGVEIRSTQCLAVLNAEHFRPFQSAARKKNIRVHIHLIENSELTGRRLDPESDPLLSKAGRRGTSSPLLNSEQVQNRLAEAVLHIDQLFIEILAESLTILDLKSNRADFFFRAASRSSREQRWIGPAMLAPFLPNFDACLLHASAIVRHGKTAIFLAPDEGGKTTAALLSPEGNILSDDQLLVRRFPEGFRAAGTPWGLRVDAKVQASLGGLFLLEKAGRFALASCPTREMIAHIWQETRNSLSILPKTLKKKAFAIICEIASSVPAWKMSFTKDHIDWAMLDQALNQKTSADAKHTIGRRRIDGQIASALIMRKICGSCSPGSAPRCTQVGQRRNELEH